MAYLTITRIAGDPHELLGGYRLSAGSMAAVGRDHGLILHAAAPTGEGLLVVNLWPSRRESEAAAADPRRAAVIRERGLEPRQIVAEHHVLEGYALFAPQAEPTRTPLKAGSTASP